MYNDFGDIMNYLETLSYIHSLGNFSLPPTLERIKAVLEELGNPQNKFKAIHIAGTNGKGSVSAMLCNVFKLAGYKTGLFISPFITDFKERISINGQYISESDLVRLAKIVIDTKIKLTEFEFITAVGFLYFAEQSIDILICETGLGGRLDATNTLENKLVTVITKIGLDHTAILGDSIEKIAGEKCGILRDCPTVTSPYQDEKALAVIKKYAKNLTIPDLTQLELIENTNYNSYIYIGRRYDLSLLGEYQIENSLIVIETVQKSGYDIPYNIIYKALNETVFPARMEIVSENPFIIIDGAHNPDGATALSKELEKHSGKVTAIVGMCKDKDCEEFLKTTLKLCKNAVAVEIKDNPRSLSDDELSVMAKKYCPCSKAKDYKDALEKAVALSNGNPIFVFGSLYLASGIRQTLKN